MKVVVQDVSIIFDLIACDIFEEFSFDEIDKRIKEWS